MELRHNEFSEFALNKDEELAGFNYSMLQRATLQNERTRLLRLKTSLGVDVEHTAVFVQEEAYLRGALEELEFLIVAFENLSTKQQLPQQPGEHPKELDQPKQE